jgi:hypothetical protein
MDASPLAEDCLEKNTYQDACMQLINRLIEKKKIGMHACNYNK